MSEPDPSSSIVVVSDLDSRGRLGRTTLTIENGIATRSELTPLGEETLGEFTVTELSNPRLEDLVDATALIADFNAHSVDQSTKPSACEPRKATESVSSRQARSRGRP
jgi:hypothetical protein